MNPTIETELKYKITGVRLRAANPSTIVGGEPIYIKGVGTDTFYYRPESKTKEFIRYRHNSDGQELTIKVKLNGNKDRVEETMMLSNTISNREVDLFMSALGHTKGDTLTKDYEVWSGRDGILTYYKVYKTGQYLGSFVEIEAYSEDDEITRNRNLQKMRDRLYELTGLSDKQRETKSIFELYGEIK